MHLIYGEKGCEYSQQDKFPEDVKCENCDCVARIAFVYHEADEKFAICNMRRKDDKLWLHDWCSVAVYFCANCLKAHVLWNQA